MRRILMLLATMVAGVLVAGGVALAADGDCQPSGSQVVCTFTYTGNAQSWTVPEGVTQATFDVSGAQGGGTPDLFEPAILPGGKGGEATATIPVTPGEMLQVNVGGKGGDGANGPGGAGGFNGGAAGGVGCCSGPGGGGGASDVRRDTDASGAFALAERIIVAGGGGGRGGFDGGVGGVGGGLSGGAGGTDNGGGGGGGTQEDGGDGGLGQVFDEQVFGDNGSKGDLGDGGDGGDGISIGDGGGGGGGGYYGGGGGGGGLSGGGGGGGSGFGPTGVVFDSGVREGDGVVTITYTLADTTAPTVTTSTPTNKADNVTATFSEPVQNVSPETFFLERKISVKKEPTKYVLVDATVYLNEVDGSYVLDPVQDLPKGEYRATITTDVTDMADPANALEEDVVWTFTVEK
jgi:hypothetical protein